MRPSQTLPHLFFKLGNETIFDNHTALTHSKRVTQGEGPATLIFIIRGETWNIRGFSPPVHIEQQNTRFNEESQSYLQKCTILDRWTLVTTKFRVMPNHAHNIKASNGNWMRFTEAYTSLQSKTPSGMKSTVPQLEEASYVLCVKSQLLQWSLA
ncbi:hypothetical protein F5879DRAFT_964862 [Lentinula edodes]|nr:hypothetical protein F5879DRAFT_964862 [Lentinula edodes]